MIWDSYCEIGIDDTLDLALSKLMGVLLPILKLKVTQQFFKKTFQSIWPQILDYKTTGRTRIVSRVMLHKCKKGSFVMYFQGLKDYVEKSKKKYKKLSLQFFLPITSQPTFLGLSP